MRAKAAAKKTTFGPYDANGEVFIIRIGFDGEDVKPTDFPIYGEYQRFMEAFYPNTDIIGYDEYQQLMGRETLV